jgi:hypothetical protein
MIKLLNYNKKKYHKVEPSAGARTRGVWCSKILVFYNRAEQSGCLQICVCTMQLAKESVRALPSTALRWFLSTGGTSTGAPVCFSQKFRNRFGDYCLHSGTFYDVSYLVDIAIWRNKIIHKQIFCLVSSFYPPKHTFRFR